MSSAEAVSVEAVAKAPAAKIVCKRLLISFTISLHQLELAGTDGAAPPLQRHRRELCKAASRMQNAFHRTNGLPVIRFLMPRVIGHSPFGRSQNIGTLS